MGRLVFIQFLQKKGWMGCTSGEWKDGDKEYPFNIAEKYFSYKTITDRILENGKYHSKIVFPTTYFLPILHFLNVISGEKSSILSI